MHCFAGRNPRSWSTSAGCAAVGSTCSNYIYAVLTAKKRLSTGITRGHVVACELIAMLPPLSGELAATAANALGAQWHCPLWVHYSFRCSCHIYQKHIFKIEQMTNN